jgi:hypothetical protein
MAGIPVEKIFGKKLESMKLLSVNNLSSILLLNNKGTLMLQKLPACMQWSPVFSFCADDFNGDGKTDIIPGGNFYGVIPYEGQYDAAAFSVVLNSNNHFRNAALKSGLTITGEVRDIKKLRSINNRSIYIVARNNVCLLFFKTAK